MFFDYYRIGFLEVSQSSSVFVQSRQLSGSYRQEGQEALKSCKRRSAATRANVTSDDDDECNDKMTKIESTFDTVYVSAQFSYSSSHNSLTKLFASLIQEYFASVGFACCHNFIFLTLLHKCA